MNVLWICNIPSPQIGKYIGVNTPYGGWIVSLLERIRCNSDISLGYAFPQNKKKKTIEKQVDGISYYGFYEKNEYKYNVKLEEEFNRIIKSFHPDIIHIFGTEMPHVTAFFRGRKNVDNVVLQIQGLVSICSKHYLEGIPIKNIYKIFIDRDMKIYSLYLDRKRFIKRGRYEIKNIKKAKYVIGRTDWDKACMWYFNPQIRYFKCNEMLRDSFYQNRWDIKKCKRHSIFISQGNYPIKGFHIFLKALKILKQRYDDIVVYVAGENIISLGNEKLTPYADYIIYLMNIYKLKNVVKFLGQLNEKLMTKRYLEANVFVSSSVIENSPNSLAEAMLLGVPCVASDVGGISSLLNHGIDGFLYNVNADYMLAYYIHQIFEDDNLANRLSKNARNHALKTHDPESCLNDIFSIYDYINKGESNI